MRKQSEIGEYIDTAWIPEKFAHVGKLVKIKKDSGEYDGPWRVSKVYGKLEASKVEASERDFLKQRKVSDI